MAAWSAIDWYRAQIRKSLGPVKQSINALVGWQRLEVDHAATWGCTVYVQESRDGAWQVRKIGADGTQVVSRSTDAANVGVSAAQAWAGRAELVYV